MSTSGSFIGIDVSKTQLDLAVHATGQPWQVAYDAAGVQRVVKHLRTLAPTLIVLSEARRSRRIWLSHDLCGLGTDPSFPQDDKVRNGAVGGIGA